MPAEDSPHERTWMCWPSSALVWGSELRAVQDTIVDIATAINDFEPVAMLLRPGELASVRARLKGIELIEAPVDDLWARDTLPSFITRRQRPGEAELGASHATFNGWGSKQIARGDVLLAGVVANHLGVQLINSGLVGEGGGVEVDGKGTVLASASSWVNRNRNPGKNRGQVASALLRMLGAERMIWIDGLAGHDITDGHVDTLARFVDDTTIIVDKPATADASDPWVRVATRTHQQVQAARTAAGLPYTIVEMNQPKTIRGTGDEFLSTYLNYYVCNDAVIAPQFGDRSADNAARSLLRRLFPGRDVVQLNVDPLAAGGGGIHCATQQQPARAG